MNIFTHQICIDSLLETINIVYYHASSCKFLQCDWKNSNVSRLVDSISFCSIACTKTEKQGESSSRRWRMEFPHVRIHSPRTIHLQCQTALHHHQTFKWRWWRNNSNNNTNNRWQWWCNHTNHISNNISNIQTAILSSLNRPWEALILLVIHSLTASRTPLPRIQADRTCFRQYSLRFPVWVDPFFDSLSMYMDNGELTFMYKVNFLFAS